MTPRNCTIWKPRVPRPSSDQARRNKQGGMRCSDHAGSRGAPGAVRHGASPAADRAGRQGRRTAQPRDHSTAPVSGLPALKPARQPWDRLEQPVDGRPDGRAASSRRVNVPGASATLIASYNASIAKRLGAPDPVTNLAVRIGAVSSPAGARWHVALGCRGAQDCRAPGRWGRVRPLPRVAGRSPRR